MLHYQTADYDTFDYIAWRVYGRQDNRIVERLVAANPGLSGSVFLPAGTMISVPVLTQQPQTQQVRLWD